MLGLDDVLLVFIIERFFVRTAIARSATRYGRWFFRSVYSFLWCRDSGTILT